MKLKKTLAVLTAALTLSVSSAIPLASSAEADTYDPYTYDEFIADIEAGVYGRKVDDNGYMANLANARMKDSCVSYDVLLNGDQKVEFIVVYYNCTGFDAEPTDYYKEHPEELQSILNELSDGTLFSPIYHVFNNTIRGAISSDKFMIEEAQELCNTLKEKGIVKNFNCSSGEAVATLFPISLGEGYFTIDLTPEQLVKATDFLNSKGISFTSNQTGIYFNKSTFEYRFKLDTEITMEEQFKLMQEILDVSGGKSNGGTLDIGIDIDPPAYETVDMYSLSPATAPKSIYGDVDQNGDVTLADAVSIVSYVADPAAYPLTEAQLNRADVQNTGDGVNTADAVAVQTYLLESVDSLPVSYAE